MAGELAPYRYSPIQNALIWPAATPHERGFATVHWAARRASGDQSGRMRADTAGVSDQAGGGVKESVMAR